MGVGANLFVRYRPAVVTPMRKLKVFVVDPPMTGGPNVLRAWGRYSMDARPVPGDARVANENRPSLAIRRVWRSRTGFRSSAVRARSTGG